MLFTLLIVSTNLLYCVYFKVLFNEFNNYSSGIYVCQAKLEYGISTNLMNINQHIHLIGCKLVGQVGVK